VRFLVGTKNEIVGVIVRWVTVFVVYHLVFRQAATKYLLHDKARTKHVSMLISARVSGREDANATGRYHGAVTVVRCVFSPLVYRAPPLAACHVAEPTQDAIAQAARGEVQRATALSTWYGHLLRIRALEFVPRVPLAHSAPPCLLLWV